MGTEKGREEEREFWQSIGTVAGRLKPQRRGTQRFRQEDDWQEHPAEEAAHGTSGGRRTGEPDSPRGSRPGRTGREPQPNRARAETRRKGKGIKNAEARRLGAAEVAEREGNSQSDRLWLRKKSTQITKIFRNSTALQLCRGAEKTVGPE